MLADRFICLITNNLGEVLSEYSAICCALQKWILVLLLARRSRNVSFASSEYLSLMPLLLVFKSTIYHLSSLINLTFYAGLVSYATLSDYLLVS